MIIPGKKVHAIFEQRLNRFVAKVNLKGESIKVHVPNSGRLKELLTPGTVVILRELGNPLRKFKYDIIMAYKDGKLVSIDSLLPNKLVKAFLEQGINTFEHNKKDIDKLFEYDFVRSEVTFKKSRFDIGLGTSNKVPVEIEKEGTYDKAEKGGIKYYMEIKGVTLVEENIARFPDAPTERGTKHLLELIEAKREGFGAGVFFVIQRQDAKFFSPNDAMDPAFGKALRAAARVGVDIFAYRCKVKPNSIELAETIKICLACRNVSLH